MKFLLGTMLLLLCFRVASAQANCGGNAALTEKKCPGDELTATEKELFKMINDYRAANNLPPVALSESLSLVANRHLLDLANNVRTFTHGWSNCPYDLKDEKTWGCVFDAPKRLKAGYDGNGYENLYRNLNGAATPALALDAWKKSQFHNNLILNLDVWKDTKFDAFGLAISGNYAAMWFGSDGGADRVGKQTKGLGVSFDKAVEGLTSVLRIKKDSALIESDRWVGRSVDKSVALEIIGRQDDIDQTTMAFSVRLEKNFQLNAQNRAVLSTFLANLTDGWNDREKWLDAALEFISKNPKGFRTLNIQNKTIEMRIGAQNKLTVLVKPTEKPRAKEI
ncbi:MAG: CAP domain-containing protein [Acidobacteria bacterium]|nr:CAP domain-containing protein [Acidobacteriota bacterium]